MAKITEDVANAVGAGSLGKDNPHYFSSTMWEAHEFGRFLRNREIPSFMVVAVDIEKGRGSSWSFQGSRFKLVYAGASGGYYWIRAK